MYVPTCKPLSKMSSIMTTAQIILQSSDNWILWLEMIKSMATTEQVWDYVDLLKATAELPDLTELKWLELSNLPLTKQE